MFQCSQFNSNHFLYSGGWLPTIHTFTSAGLKSMIRSFIMHMKDYRPIFSIDIHIIYVSYPQVSIVPLCILHIIDPYYAQIAILYKYHTLRYPQFHYAYETLQIHIIHRYRYHIIKYYTHLDIHGSIMYMKHYRPILSIDIHIIYIYIQV